MKYVSFALAGLIVIGVTFGGLPAEPNKAFLLGGLLMFSVSWGLYND